MSSESDWVMVESLCVTGKNGGVSHGPACVWTTLCVSLAVRLVVVICHASAPESFPSLI